MNVCTLHVPDPDVYKTSQRRGSEAEAEAEVSTTTVDSSDTARAFHPAEFHVGKNDVLSIRLFNQAIMRFSIGLWSRSRV